MIARGEALFGLVLDHAQGQLVMEALGERPYRGVHALVQRLNAWGGEVFAGAGPAPVPPFALSSAELEQVLQALADLPYRRVYVLIGSLRAQLEQLREGQPAARAANG